MTPLRVALRVDASRDVGVGHVARAIALADEIVSRGGAVQIFGSVTGASWLLDAIAHRGLTVSPAPDHPTTLRDAVQAAGCTAVILDGYAFDPGTGAALKAAGLTVLAVQDGPFGAGQTADLVLDQNLGATDEFVPPGVPALLGLEYTLMRNEVLEARTDQHPGRDVPKGVIFCGGTDPQAAAPFLTDLVIRTRSAIELTVVAATDAIAADLARLLPRLGQQIDVISPTPQIVQIAANCDFAVVAAGGSVWELLCVGVPAAVVAVADNQEPTIRTIGATGAALALGTLRDLRSSSAAQDGAVTMLRRLIDSPRERRDVSARAGQLIDGRGRARVIDELSRAVARRSDCTARDRPGSEA
ncbi:MAG TPA: spore coat protein [Brevibacterium sp.]|nr:spore coat protein [Brevibacterium sp.]